MMGELLTTMVANDAFTQALTNPLLSRSVFTEDTFSPVGMNIIKETDSLQQLVARNSPSPDTVIASLRYSPEAMPDSRARRSDNPPKYRHAATRLSAMRLSGGADKTTPRHASTKDWSLDPNTTPETHRAQIAHADPGPRSRPSDSCDLVKGARCAGPTGGRETPERALASSRPGE